MSKYLTAVSFLPKLLFFSKIKKCSKLHNGWNQSYVSLYEVFVSILKHTGNKMHFTNSFRNDLTNVVLKMSVIVRSSTYFTEGRIVWGGGEVL